VEVDKWKHGYNTYYSRFRDMDEVVMEINTGMRSIYRYIFLDAEDWELLTSELEEQEAFRKAYMELPALGTNATAVDFDEIDGEAAKEVYNVLREEVAGMEFGDWYTIAEGSLYRGNRLELMTLATAIGSETYASAFPIVPEMKKTAKAYVEAFNGTRASDGEAILDFLKNIETMKFEHMNLWVQPLKAEFDREVTMDRQEDKVTMEAYYDGLHYYGYNGQMEGNTSYISWEDMANALLANGEKPVDVDGVYGLVNLDLELLDEKGNWVGESYRYYFNLEGLDLQELVE